MDGGERDGGDRNTDGIGIGSGWMHKIITELGGAGNRFGDYVCVDCANQTCLTV